ncbi:hypothetical protein ACH5RR_009055 [Cinchona calisaya]|uniref:Uncharacterized protein n=1 Tax=Cinchona calisaya TaxID=153742 RepID=A0ABD3AF05_9GENT
MRNRNLDGIEEERSETEYSVPQSSTSSYGRTIVIHDTPRDQVRVEQPVLETPQTADNDPVDPVQPIPEIVEQPVNQAISSIKYLCKAHPNITSMKLASTKNYLIDEKGLRSKGNFDVFSYEMPMKLCHEFDGSVHEKISSLDVGDGVNIVECKKSLRNWAKDFSELAKLHWQSSRIFEMCVLVEERIPDTRLNEKRIRTDDII